MFSFVDILLIKTCIIKLLLHVTIYYIYICCNIAINSFKNTYEYKKKIIMRKDNNEKKNNLNNKIKKYIIS